MQILEIGLDAMKYLPHQIYKIITLTIVAPLSIRKFLHTRRCYKIYIYKNYQH